MEDDDSFDQRLVKPALAYAKLYPSVITRLKASYDSGHPMVRQLARAIETASERAEQHRREHLRDVHGLSPKEAEIALHLMDGGTVATCTEALGVAESTIRTHVKSIFGKTGIQRQADLRTLLPTPRQR